MKYVVFCLATVLGALALKSAGVRSFETEYWLIVTSYQLAGYCIARMTK